MEGKLIATVSESTNFGRVRTAIFKSLVQVMVD